MITTRHRTMLRAICARPRTAREFTSAQHDALSPNACASHLNELVKQGLIEVNADGLYEATEAGQKHNSQPSTPPRTFCNATTTGTYTGPAWNIRAGSDRAAAIPSRGTGC
jgi:predicted transcriptional regulator